MDEDPYGALRSPEHAGDLGSRHLLDEPQDERPAPIGGQPTDGTPGCGRLVAGRRAALDVERVGDERRGLDRGLWMATTATPLVGDDVSGDPEEPDAERRRPVAVGRPGTLLEPVEVRQGGKERSLGGVLGFVMIAELVERVAVHLGQVPAIEGVEAGGVPAGLLDE